MKARQGLSKATPAAFLALALAAPAMAQDTWLQNDKAYRGKDAAQSGEFATLQVSTIEPNQFMADWERPSAGVKLVSQDRVGRGKPVVTFIIFRGCRPDPKGACNVTVDFRVTDPTGKTYNETNGAEVWVGRPPPPGRAIQLSAGGLGLSFDPEDPSGDYRVTAKVTDHVAGITLQTEKLLTLVTD